MANPFGPLGPADERFDHQIADTFATVGASDPSWTEKVCAMAARRDGRLQLGFGMGKYTNRNVLDGYAGMSRGAEQITVRGSRRLFPESGRPRRSAPSATRFSSPCGGCGSRSTRISASRWPSTGSSRRPCRRPPRTAPIQRVPLGYRVSADLVRYHQIGVASGWVEHRRRAPGDRPGGVGLHPRPQRGASATTSGPRRPTPTPSTRWLEMDFQMIWSPTLMTDPDGTRWGLFMHLIDAGGFGHQRRTVMGAVEHADGRRRADEPTSDPISPTTRPTAASCGGEVKVTMEDGTASALHLEVPTRHRLPSRGRPLLRLAGPPPRRVARGAPRRR